MCGRFSLELDDTFYPRFEIDNIIEISPNFNIAPYSYIPAIVKHSPKKVLKMRWGYIPSWSKEFNSKYSTINTRAESIDNKAYFKDAFKNNRCLIPATGFYEWKEEDDKSKTPYYIHLKDTQYFSFAGIYSIWREGSGLEKYTCSIITTKPNKIISTIHDRMPVILSKEEEEIWVDKDNREYSKLKELLDPYPSKEIQMYEVSKDVNTPKNNSKEIIKPIANNR